MIPSKLRNKLSLETGDTLNYYIHQDKGHIYLCLRCKAVENEIDKALKILEKNEINIAEALDRIRQS